MPRYALYLDINNLFSDAVNTQKNLERCPYVVHTFDTGDIDGQPYMVMEWVMDGEAQGNSLRRGLKRESLPLLQRYDDALTDFDIVTRFGDENAEYYSFMLYWRGHLHRDAGRYDDALADWTQALQITPHDDQIYFNRADLYSKLARYSDSIADYTRSLHLNPQQVEAYSNRGDVYSLVRRYQDALADYASL